jgi:hypothetical protein
MVAAPLPSILSNWTWMTCLETNGLHSKSICYLAKNVFRNKRLPKK